MTTARLSSIAGVDARRGRRLDLKRRRRCRSPSAFDRNRLASARSPLSTTSDRHRLARREDEVEGVVGRAADRCRRCTMPRTFGSASVNGANDTDADACGATVAALGLDLVAVDRQRRPARP